MHDECRQVHLRTAGETTAPGNGNPLDGNPRVDDARGVVVPNLRHADHASEHLPGQHAEIADPDVLTHEQPMQPAEGVVAREEADAVVPFEPLCEDRPVRAGGCRGRQQGGERVRGILAIAVHHDDGVGCAAGGDRRQTDGDRPLVAKIASQPQHLDRGNSLRRPGQRPTLFLSRAVVHEEHLEPMGQRRRDAVEFLKQQPAAGRVVVDRDADRDIEATVTHCRVVPRGPSERNRVACPPGVRRPRCRPGRGRAGRPAGGPHRG